MDNTYYLMSKEVSEIERFHICTWEALTGSTYIEFGAEIKKESIGNNNEVVFYLAIPSVTKDSMVKDLSKELSDDNNARFIFNDRVSGHSGLGEEHDYRTGVLKEFVNRNPLIILPSTITKEDSYITITLNIPSDTHTSPSDAPIKSTDKKVSYYFRILVGFNQTIAEKTNTHISRKNYIYDIKINKIRNISDEVFKLKENRKFCSIKQMFCLHVIPDSFELNFVDSKALKDIRKLEVEAFKKYLPKKEEGSKKTHIETDHRNIVFLKKGKEQDQKQPVDYSFFTVCTDESIGIKQVALALLANIIVSCSFAIHTFRTCIYNNNGECWVNQLPLEYWIIFGLFLIMIFILLFGHYISIRWFKFCSFISKHCKR